MSFSKLDCIEIEENHIGYPAKYLNVPKHYINDIEKILVPNGLIHDRTQALATQIFNEFAKPSGENIICLCVLKGGYRFFSELSQEILSLNRPNNDKYLKLQLEFVRVKSYVNTESSGNVEIIGIDDISKIAGKNVMIVEDLIDTGKSMLNLIPYLKQFQPKTLKCCSLLIKRTHKSLGYIPDYIGFSIPDDFVVGYAIDYNDQFRDLEV